MRCSCTQALERWTFNIKHEVDKDGARVEQAEKPERELQSEIAGGLCGWGLCQGETIPLAASSPAPSNNRTSHKASRLHDAPAFLRFRTRSDHPPNHGQRHLPAPH